MTNYDPTMSLLSTNTMLQARTGNYLLDTIMIMIMTAIFTYVNTNGKKLFMYISQKLKPYWSEKYTVRFQARLYSRGSNESMTPTFVALVDWLDEQLVEGRLRNNNQLMEHQLPRFMTLVLEANEEENNDSQCTICKFNKGMMLLDQEDAVYHMTHPIVIRHHSHIGTSGGESNFFGSQNKAIEYSEHILSLSSNEMTANELQTFVNDVILTRWREKRKLREKNKLYYFLFDSYDAEEEYPNYEMYEWRSTKLPKHVISEHTEVIMSRVKHFINQPEWYMQKGIPYSLKFLLHGPPGCGKTSIIKAVANYTRRHIKEIPLQRVKSRQALMEIMHNPRIGFKVIKPCDCIFVFEEFDKMGSVVEEVNNDIKKETPVTQDTIQKVLNKVVQEETKTAKRDEFTKKGTPPLSLGDILNVMDGLLETDGMLIFMTANKIDTLNKAIMRPGRVDMKLKFEKCSTGSVKKIIRAAYDIPNDQSCPELDTIDDDDERFQKKWTPAEIQELCMQEDTTSDVISLLENEHCSDCDSI